MLIVWCKWWHELWPYWHDPSNYIVWNAITMRYPIHLLQHQWQCHNIQNNRQVYGCTRWLPIPLHCRWMFTWIFSVSNIQNNDSESMKWIFFGWKWNDQSKMEKFGHVCWFIRNGLQLSCTEPMLSIYSFLPMTWPWLHSNALVRHLLKMFRRNNYSSWMNYFHRIKCLWAVQLWHRTIDWSIGWWQFSFSYRFYDKRKSNSSKNSVPICQ